MIDVKHSPPSHLEFRKLPTDGNHVRQQLAVAILLSSKPSKQCQPSLAYDPPARPHWLGVPLESVSEPVQSKELNIAWLSD